MRIYLIHLINDFNLGGSTTYLVHLYEQFKSFGYDPIVLKLGRKRRTIHYYHVPINYLLQDEILHLAKKEKSIITYCFWKENSNLCKRLIRMGIPLVVHDPAEFHDEWLDIAKNVDNTIVIREKNQRNLQKLGIKSTFIQHPYIRAENRLEKKKFAIAATRIDFRKHTEIICQYNEMAANKIDIYGEVNRMAEYHALKQKFPQWRDNYHGIIPSILHEQVKVVSEYEYAIDLTAIKTDGGGTQYCFLEAWDAGSYLILNKQWDTGIDSILIHGKNCFFIQDAIELQEVLQNRMKYDKEAAQEMLNYHAADKVIPQYISRL